jgi:hypothetical protein
MNKPNDGAQLELREFEDRLEDATKRHLLALALENPPDETLRYRLARAEAMQEQLRDLLSDAVRQKLQADFVNDLALHVLKELPSAIASHSAKARAQSRYANDPKQDSKRLVRECWDNWQANLSLYKSQAAFARDMMTKFGVEVGGNLESEATITNKWIPAFKRETQKR